MTPQSFELIERFNSIPMRIPINKCELEEVIVSLFDLMFPVCCNSFEDRHARERLAANAEILHENISKLTTPAFADKAVENFLRAFPEITERLGKDARAYLKHDPAAKSIEEVVIAYPGFFALSIYRIAHQLYLLNVPIIPRLFSEYAHSKVGIDVHPGAKIVKNFFMDHGTGIVIGETAEIGDNVKIYQWVTLGALYVEKKLSEVKRHPTVEDNVVIYANATILGGKTLIGHDSVIGGGAWLTESVIPYSLVYNSMDVRIRTVKDFVQPNNFVI